MAKIAIYSDAHLSRYSSQLISSSGRYSKRLDSLIESFKWMYNLCKEEKVSTIINCGDLVSSDNLSADVNSALSEALRNSYCKEYHIIGNHERKSESADFSSVSLLQNFDNINLIKDYLEVEIEGINFIFQSFTKNNDDYKRIITNTKNSEKPVIVCSHQVYKGSLPVDLEESWDIKELSCDNLIRVFNGHVHNPLDNGKYSQVGSLSGNDFGDKYNRLPGIIILDTETFEITRYENPHAILYFTIEVNSLEDINKGLEKLPVLQEKIIRLVIGDYNLSEEIRNFKSDRNYNVLKFVYKLKKGSSKKINIEKSDTNNTNTINIFDALTTFLSNLEDFLWTSEEVNTFLQELEEV